MKIEYIVADDKVRGFTDDAKARLQEQSQKYTMEIISEAEKFEEVFRENGASSEITDSIVMQAVKAIRRRKVSGKDKAKRVFFSLLAEALTLVIGWMFIPEKFITAENTLNVSYFFWFIALTMLALIVTFVALTVGGD